AVACTTPTAHALRLPPTLPPLLRRWYLEAPLASHSRTPPVSSLPLGVRCVSPPPNFLHSSLHPAAFPSTPSVFFFSASLTCRPENMSKKIVVKVDLHDNKDKQKALKAISVLVGIDAVSVDMAAHKMTVIGTVDPVDVVSKLRNKSWAAHIDSVGPAKEPEKKEEKKDAGGGDAKKEGDGAKKEEGDGAKKEGDGAKKEGEGKKEEGGDAKKEGEGEGKKEGDGKKDGDEKKEGDGKKEEGGGEEKKAAPAPAPAPMPFPMHHLPPPYMNMITADYMNQYRPPPPPPAYHPYAPAPYYYVRNMSMEENPNSCAIC
ncbi:unnamed protein product, partial [Urochloa humidicola]